ncbi:MAG: AMP-binding protein, partial [Myxococcota bacterium]|nr:AMP-binding protein [Myxococcota bacterium]
MPFPDYEPSLPVFLQTRIERFGERPLAVLNDDRIGYAEAGERSARLARGLLAAGITKGTRVGLLMPNGPDWVVAWLAAARIGAVVVPLNTFYKPRELGWVLKHADVHTLLSVPSLLNNDYVTRLETAVPELAGQEAGALVTPELPYLRAVIMWGKCDRSWAGSHDDLEAAAKAKP